MRTAPGKAPGAVLFLALMAVGVATMAVPAAVAAQEDPGITVVGYVTDDSTGARLGGVVLLADDGTRATTDPDGSYLLRGLKPGEREFLVVGRGCRQSAVRFELGPESPIRLDFRLTFGPSPFAASRDAPPEDPRARLVTEDQIRDWGVSTLTQVLQRVAPGLVQGGSGQPGDVRFMIGRGGRTQADDKAPIIVVDDAIIPIEDTAMLDEIPPRDIAWIQILPGAIGGWEYGTQGTGGVIRIKTKSGVDMTLQDMDPEECIRYDG